MIKLVNDIEARRVTSSEVEWYVSPGTFERMRALGYNEASFGEGEWVYEPHEIPLLVRLAGGLAYRKTGVWAFFHPAGKIAVVENPKARIRHENGEQQHTPLPRNERTFGLFGRFGARRSYESYLRTYKIQMGEHVGLQEFMGSQVYSYAMRGWELKREKRQQNAVQN